MNREGAPGKSPEEMYIQQKVRVLLMLRKMGSNLTASEEEFLRTYAGVVNSQLSQLPQHSIDQGKEAGLQKQEQTPGSEPGAGEESLGRWFSAAEFPSACPSPPRSPLT
ncbi:beta-catenin-interacting protein 1 isoform X2 [Vicugna pacos]|uniref:Beta-catenin-interacting protein 1 isoform X2 n=1 Tax=Vicugna pacos TaxID=30538 RepID=A0ABM5EEE8_VICPA